MPRYVVIGAGAIGVSIAAEMTEAGIDVALIARGSQLAAARAGGITYVTPRGERTVTADVYGQPSDITLTPDDILVLATKTQDAQAALITWASAPVQLHSGDLTTAGAALPILTTQNGIETERVALRHFTKVIGCVLGIPADLVEPGVVVCPAGPYTGAAWLGLYPTGKADLVERIASDLRAANFDAEVVAEISEYKNAKLLVSVTFALDALFEPSPLRDRLADKVRAEAKDVLTRAGQGIGELSGQHGQRFSIQPLPRHKYGGNSTWQSLTRAGSVETDYLNGEVVLQARLLGIEAPISQVVVESIHRAAQNRIDARSLTDADIRALFPQLEDNVSAESVLITPGALQLALAGANPPALLDVRWKLGDPDGRLHYQREHIPGAVYVDLDSELAEHGTPQAGRHPLPSIATLQAAARRWGLAQGQPVVVYDDNGGMSAARAWWLLRWAGVADVKILNGSLASWREHEFPVESAVVSPAAGDVTLSPDHLPTLSADDAARIASGEGLLLDARAGERYRGESEPIDSRAGHIPGAVSAPTAANLDASGKFLDEQSLRARFSDLGAQSATDIGVYCGSGVTAAHLAAALQIAGFNPALFPGSWSAWSSDPDRPAAVGATP